MHSMHSACPIKPVTVTIWQVLILTHHPCNMAPMAGSPVQLDCGARSASRSRTTVPACSRIYGAQYAQCNLRGVCHLEDAV